MTDARHVDQPPPTPSERQAAANSVGELLSEVSRDISTLMRQEVDLAKAELRRNQQAAPARAPDCSAGPESLGHPALVFVSVALWWALGYLMGNAWSALLVAVIPASSPSCSRSSESSEIESISGMPNTVDTLKEIPETLKRNEENRCRIRDEIRARHRTDPRRTGPRCGCPRRQGEPHEDRRTPKAAR